VTHLALILVQVLFASLAVVGRLVLPFVPPGVLVACRILGAALALLLFNLFRRGPWISDRAVLARIAVCAWLGVTANQALFLFGLRQTTALNATILVTTVPVFTVMGSLLLRVETPSPLKLAGIALAGAGATYLVGPERLSFAPGVALGNLYILLGMMAYAAYFLLSKPIVAAYDPVTVSVYVMLFAAAGVLPIGVPALFASHLESVSRATWLLVGYLVLGPTILAYFLNLWALRRVSPNTVASFTYLQPALAALATPLVLPGEHLNSRTLVSGAGIFLGLALVIRGEGVQRRQVQIEPGVGE